MIKEKNLVKPMNRRKFYQDSKKHKEYFFDTASLLFFQQVFFYKKKFSKKNSYGKIFVPFLLPRNKSIDINTKEDLNFLKRLMKK